MPDADDMASATGCAGVDGGDARVDDECLVLRMADRQEEMQFEDDDDDRPATGDGII